jgi:hypothetical protein
LKDFKVEANILYYRIVAVDFDGYRTYSNVKKVNLNGQKQAINIFPNPILDKATISIKSDVNNTTNIYVYDNIGNCVFIRNGVQLFAGTNYIEVNFSNLKTGNYIVSLSNSSHTVNNLIFTKL